MVECRFCDTHLNFALIFLHFWTTKKRYILYNQGWFCLRRLSPGVSYLREVFRPQSVWTEYLHLLYIYFTNSWCWRRLRYVALFQISIFSLAFYTFRVAFWKGQCFGPSSVFFAPHVSSVWIQNLDLSFIVIQRGGS